MATCLTSDSVHDYPCTSCAVDDINRESVIMCVTCNQYLCNSCLKFHNRMTGGNEHRLLDETDFKNVTKRRASLLDLPTDTCSVHRGKLVDMYCEDHDETSCSVCMVLHHRACETIHFIPDIASHIDVTKDVVNAKANLSRLVTEFESLKEDRQSHKTRLSNETAIALRQVKERRIALEKYLDETENELCDSTTAKHQECSGKLDDDIFLCDDVIKGLENINSKLQDAANGHNASQTFVSVKIANRMIQDNNTKWNTCNKNGNDLPRMSFHVGKAVGDLLHPWSMFGCLKSCYKIPKGLNSLETVNISHAMDTSESSCYGICQLPNGSLILTDWTNNSIKSLTRDTSYKLADALVLSSKPWGICAVDDREVAVTMPYGQTVTFVTTEPKLTVKRSFKVADRCHGVIYANGRLYITDNTNADIKTYSLKGDCLGVISKDGSGSPMFGKPSHMCLWPGKEQIAVVDSTQGVKVIDMVGNIIGRYTYAYKKWPFGVCVDSDGNVFIADGGSEEIVAIGARGNVVTLKKTDKKPTMIYFQKDTWKFFIGFEKSDLIQIYSFVY